MAEVFGPLTAAGMQADVRPLEASDVPSPYDNSDVIPASATQLKDMLQEGSGLLLALTAQWCARSRRGTQTCGWVRTRMRAGPAARR